MAEENQIKQVVTAESVESEERRDQMFAALAANLDRQLGVVLADKVSVEDRMLRDEAQYWGVSQGGFDKEDVAQGHTNKRTATGMPVDNKTRSKTRIAASRIGDMLFPTNSPNWDMRPTPYPEVPIPLLMEEYRKQVEAAAPPAQPVMDPSGAPEQPPMDVQGMAGPPQDSPMMGPANPAPEVDYERLALKVATKRCRRMRQLIRDVLSENDYNRIGRDVIMDGCKTGTGVIKGPYVTYTTRRSYEQVEDESGPIAVARVERKVIPGVSRVSPWMFFPQRARSIEDCEYAFELHTLNRTQLMQMVETHGFFPRQVSKLMRRKPSLGKVESVLARRATITNYSMQRYENMYAVWEYHGLIDVELLREMGFDIPEEEDGMDNLKNLMGSVWMSEGEILRVDMAPLEAASRLPYHVWNYEEDETHVFGFGVPYIMRDDQAVIDMVWSAILHNTSVSAGPQLAIEKGVMRPADGSFSIRGPKLWYKEDVDVPMAQAMEAFVVPNTLNNTMPVYQQAQQNADENTMLPHILGTSQAKGQEGGASGMVHVAMMNQSNIVQRQAAHQWDDNITDPLISALYQWFMESDEPDAVAAHGDYEVEVRGASHLLVKDTQAQHVQLLMQMAASDPTMAAQLNLNDVYRLYLSFLDVPIDTLVKTPEEVEAEAANQQPDPYAEAELALKQAQAEAAKAKAQADMARAEADKMRAEAMMIEATSSQSMDVIDHSEVMALELRYAEMRDKQNDRDLQLQLKLIDRETKLTEIAAKQGLEYDKLEAKIQSDRERALADLQITESQRQSKDYFDAARLRLDQYKEELRTRNLAKGYDSFG